MPVDVSGAQRASGHRVHGTHVLALALCAVVAALTTAAGPAGATEPGPSPSATISASPSPITTASPYPDASATTPAQTSAPPSASPVPAAPVVPDPAASAAPAASVVLAVRVHPKVVVIVGPVGSQTATYVRRARALAAQARSYGATVVELYSPNATWARVKAAARGAKVLIYLGHGNGYPNPYGPFDPMQADGLGLNAIAGAGNGNTRYFGEALIARGISLAPGAVVILNHLCYASGDNEWGQGNPTRATAIRRVDNYGAGFLRAGAAAVIADGLDSPGYVLRSLFRANRTIRQIFWSSAGATRTWTVLFASRRTSGAKAVMDPYAPSRYYRSAIGALDVRVSAWH